MSVDYDQLISKNCKNIPRSFVREILEVAEGDEMISLAGGLPNPAFFPVQQMKEAFHKLMDADGKHTLQYAGSQGYLPLRQWICDRYNAKYGMSITPENILITNGSQQALDLLGKMFINPGDPLILEKPSYLGAIQAFSAYLPQFHQVNLADDGIDLNELERVILETGAQVLYGIPNFQNPSGISYSEEKRAGLAELMNWYGLMFIEDDPYNEVRFEGEFLPPVYTHCPEQTIWCGSFSKMISPGIRAGWICAPTQLMPYLLRAKQASDLHTNNIVQRIVYRFLHDNDLEAHLSCIRQAYKKQKDCMVRAIQTYFPEEVVCTNPEGGMFLWATLPDFLNADELVNEAIRQKVVFVPGRSFFTAEDGSRNMRLNFSNASEEMIEEGIKRIGMVLKTAMARTVSV